MFVLLEIIKIFYFWEFERKERVGLAQRERDKEGDWFFKDSKS
jgi:hypothetical protein